MAQDIVECQAEQESSFSLELLNVAEQRNVILYSTCEHEKLILCGLLMKLADSHFRWDSKKTTYMLTHNVDNMLAYKCYLQEVAHLSTTILDTRRKKDGCIDDRILQPIEHYVMLLQSGRIRIGNANLIILDEGYRTSVSSSLCIIMEQLKRTDPNNRPYVVTLRVEGNPFCFIRPGCSQNNETSDRNPSFGVETREVIMYKCCGLDGMGNYCFRKYMKPIARIIGIENIPHIFLSEKYPQFFSKNELLMKLKNLLNDYWNVFSSLGLNGVAYYCTYLKLRLLYLNRDMTKTMLEKSLLSTALKSVIDMEQNMLENVSKKELALNMENISPKFHKLWDIISDACLSKPYLIVVSRPAVSYCMYFLFKVLFKHHGLDAKVNYLVGCNSDNKMMRQYVYKQEIKDEIIRCFNKQELNILILSRATGELQKIRKCDVLLYDEVSLEDYVMLMNWLFGSQNKIQIFAPKKKFQKVAEVYDTYRDEFYKTVKELDFHENGVLLVRFIERFDVSNCGSEIKNIADVPEYPAFCFQDLKECIDRLPHDKFTSLRPVLYVTTGMPNKTIYSLCLPVNSVIRNFVYLDNAPSSRFDVLNGSGVMTVLKLCADAAKQLKERSLLTDTFASKIFLTENEPLYVESGRVTLKFPNLVAEDEKETNERIVDCLEPVWFKTERAEIKFSYVHLIRIQPQYPEPSVNRKRYSYNLWKCDSTYGLITKEKLPKVCSFPLYAGERKVRVSIVVNAFTVRLSKQQMEALWMFHKFVVLEIVNLVKGPLVAGDYKHSPYIIAPICKDEKCQKMVIDWNTIKETETFVPRPRVKESDTLLSPTSDKEYKTKGQHEQTVEQKRATLAHRDYEAYIGRVILASYRDNISWRHYVVTAVNYNMSPLSKFSGEDYGTYADYYREKYNIHLDLSQPLVEVDLLPTITDMFRPPDQTTARRKRPLFDKDYEEYHATEICEMKPLAAVYWWKSVVLPFVDDRLHYILLAEMLKLNVAQLLNSKSNLEAAQHFETKDDEELKVAVVDSYVSQESGRYENYPITDAAAILKVLSPYQTDDSVATDIYRIENPDMLQILYYDNFMNTPYDYYPHWIPEEFSSSSSLYKIKMLDLTGVTRVPSQTDILEAITVSSSQDVFDCQLLKTFGTSVLKFVITVSLYHMLDSENDTTRLRKLLKLATGKRNLFSCGLKLNLGSYLKVHGFLSSMPFFAPGFYVPDYIVNKLKAAEIPANSLCRIVIDRYEQFSGSGDMLPDVHETLISYLEQEGECNGLHDNPVGVTFFRKQHVTDVMISDCIKALIAKFAEKCGIENTATFIEKISIMNISCMPDSEEKCSKSSEKIDSVDDLPDYSGLEEILRYQFRDKRLLRDALTHPTCTHPEVNVCYHRFSFLGEAVLGLLIASYLYEHHNNLPLDDFIDVLDSLTDDITYACIAARFNFHQYLIFDSKNVHFMLEKFIEKLRKRKFEISYELLYLLEEVECSHTEQVEVPSVFSHIFKSIAGAIFVDSGRELNVVWDVYCPLMRDVICNFSSVPKLPLYILKESHFKYTFESPVHDGPYVKVILRVTTETEDRTYHGCGKTKKQAKKSAAKLCLRDIGKGLDALY